jgi:hypothetical protein
MKFATILLSVCLGLPLLTIPATPAAASSIAYPEIKPARRKVDLGKLKIDNALMDDQRNTDDNHNCVVLSKTLCIAIGHDRTHRYQPDTAAGDYGLRLFLIEKTNEGFQIRYKSTGAKDIWGMMPKFYRHPTNGSILILAELNFEYFDGMEVFIFQDETVKDIGYLDVAIEGNSILPYTQIHLEDNITIFRFSREVYLHPNGLEPPKKLNADQIYYTYDGKSLKEFLHGKAGVMMAQNQRQFPDKIVATKMIRGRFVSIVQGDYFYAKIKTASGVKTFLIDGNESCFLQQHPQESLRIDYDVVDRYTPELNGYRRINIIRNITSRLNNLQRWRRTVTKEALAACQ